MRTIYSKWDWVPSRWKCFLPLNAGFFLKFMVPNPGRPKTTTVEMRRVEIAINPELLDLFDAWWRSNHYPTRNEALRQILRERVDRAS